MFRRETAKNDVENATGEGGRGNGGVCGAIIFRAQIGGVADLTGALVAHLHGDARGCFGAGGVIAAALDADAYLDWHVTAADDRGVVDLIHADGCAVWVGSAFDLLPAGALPADEHELWMICIARL